MATSAFKSTTKRSTNSIFGADDAAATPIPLLSSSSRNINSSRLLRSRSLSRGPSPSRGRFVNTVRGSSGNFISLDDYDDNNRRFFSNRRNEDVDNEVEGRSSRARSAARRSSINNQRRSRSVSRPHTNNNNSNSNSNSRRLLREDGGINSNNNNKTATSGSASIGRRRSLSVARYNHFSDSESDIDHSHKSSDEANIKSVGTCNYKKSSLNKPVSLNHQRVLSRSLSLKDLSKSYDGYSSHSSALTDEEARDTHSHKNGTERTIYTVYSQKKTAHPTSDGAQTGMYEVMREELRHAVENIRTEIEQGIVKANHSVLAVDNCFQSHDSDVLQAVSVIRKNYTAQLEQSEKRKQDLLAEIVAEEQRGQELSKIVKEFLPDPKNTAVQEKASVGRKNNDRSWMSKCLTEDAEKYIDDFLSNVEDTDISSFDGERSEASSTLGVRKTRDLILHFGESEASGSSTRSTSLPLEMDGVVLPWLQWETGNDGSRLLCKSKEEVSRNPEDKSCGSPQGERTACNGSNLFTTCRPSCSFEGGNPSVFTRDDINNRFGDCRSYISRSPARRPKESHFDMDEYLHIQRGEELAVEAWRQRKHISSGALVLCSRSCLQL